MTSKPINPAQSASFVQVVQPNYEWTEQEAGGDESRVVLPARGDTKATIVTPSQNTPAARAVRAHELLHARYTPDIVPIARKLTNHGVSPVAVNFAEDVRLSKFAAEKEIYKLADAHFDDDVVRAYLLNISKRHGINTPTHERTPHFTTGKAVQAAIGLIPHPVESQSIDKNSVQSILEVVEVQLGGDKTWGKVDLAKAQALFDEARATIAEIESKAYRGPKAIDAKFVDIANTIEDVLRRAYEVTEPPKGGSGDGEGESNGKGDNESGSGSSGGAGSEAGSEGENDAQQAEPQAEEKPEPKAKGGRPKNDKPELKDRGASPLNDVLPPIKKPKRGSGKPVSSSDMSEAVADTNATSAFDVSRQQQPSSEDAQKLVTNEILLADYSLETHWVGWGKLDIKMAPLVRSKKALVPRRGRAGVDGTIPKHFHRWFSDREILDTKGRRPGGTLLIDGSGSMSWSLEKTRRLIDVCPALTVAIYSSHDRDNARGVLTILARQGRACDPKFNYDHEHFHGHGNVVDGPALEWLCKQAGPRVWFSDGQVSGARESFVMPALQDAFRLAAAGQVTRTISFHTVVDVLGGKIKPFPVSPSFVAEISKTGSRDVHEYFRKLRDEDAKREYERERAQVIAEVNANVGAA